ncbi:hypothetical protein A6E19_09515 [Pseudomonas putida]|nr:hypothetical protein A6E23_10200 [Pseudomonas putida]OCT32565.1 hypothetical protein A6E20_02985 [Pseudomonas putida]OCT36684.1 hypothetical protein A6E24_20830 [Pseudomonas putida]OCT38562.1 hypothetical protein A6E19_09515 [Pseudomonas putida]
MSSPLEMSLGRVGDMHPKPSRLQAKSGRAFKRIGKGAAMGQINGGYRNEKRAEGSFDGH